ncbi:MAG: DUF2059 domain-containing protein [Thiolinea sp.]
MKMVLLITVLPLFLLQGIILAEESITNTLKNRYLQADRYLEVNSPQEIFEEIAESTQYMLPESERQNFVDTLTKHLDMDVLTDGMRASLVKTFTAEEIAVLADFYSKPAAKSAMNKMGLYMSDIMPVVQSEMFKAQQKVLQEKSE